MKKNLRIVSAAAAALLAVAPVASSVVSTVSAAPINVIGGTGTATATTGSIRLSVTNLADLANNDSAAKVKADLTSTLPAGATIVANTDARVYLVDPKTGEADTTKPSEQYLTTGNTYQVVANVTITGLAKKDNGGTTEYTINNTKATANSQGVIADFQVKGDTFSLNDATKTGAPYAKEIATGKAVERGSVDLGSTATTVSNLIAMIESKYAVGITTAAGTNPASPRWASSEQDVRDGLKAAGITVRANGSFDKPVASFPVTMHLAASNGKTNTFVVTVNPNSTEGDETFPQMTYGTNPAFAGTHTLPALNDDEKFNYVPVNGTVDTQAIANAFVTTVSKSDTTRMTPTVDVSKVNTKVAGKYPVVVSATNADKKTTKVTFMLTVGEKGATYKVVQADINEVPVYEINGNTVTTSKTTVKNGDQIATYGDEIKVGDKSYTRINSATSNQYVETKYVDGSVKPVEKVAKKVMHNAYIYDANHKRVGAKTLAAYSTVDVYGVATKLADGSLVYKIGDNQYVMADNIDGTARTLTHNAYVYKTSKKRANRVVLRKGATVTTYGSPYTFKNGKAYYRVGGPAKQYVKVANF